MYFEIVKNIQNINAVFYSNIYILYINIQLYVTHILCSTHTYDSYVDFFIHVKKRFFYFGSLKLQLPVNEEFSPDINNIII